MSRPLLPDGRPTANREVGEGDCSGHVLGNCRDREALSCPPETCSSPRGGHGRVRIVGEAWKQVAVQETEKPEPLRRILWGTWGMRMEKPAGGGIGQQGDGEQMC